MEPTIATPSVANTEAAPSEVTESPKTEAANTAEETAPKSTADDPNESFSDWLKRQNGAKEEAKVDKTPSTKPTEDITSKETVKEPEAPKESSLKIGDKEYKAADIESLQKAHDEANAKVERINAQVNDLVEMIKSNPGPILDKLGVGRDIIEKYYYDKYLHADVFKGLPAEEKVRHYEEQEAKRAEEARVKAETEAKAAEEAKLREAAEANQKLFIDKIGKALDAAKIPKSDWTMQKMADYIQRAQEKGIQAGLNEIADLVREDLAEIQKATLTTMSPKDLAKVLGEETMAKIRAEDVAKFKQDKFENKNPSKTKVERPQKEKKRYSSPYQMIDDL